MPEIEGYDLVYNYKDKRWEAAPRMKKEVVKDPWKGLSSEPTSSSVVVMFQPDETTGPPPNPPAKYKRDSPEYRAVLRERLKLARKIKSLRRSHISHKSVTFNEKKTEDSPGTIGSTSRQ